VSDRAFLGPADTYLENRRIVFAEDYEQLERELDEAREIAKKYEDRYFDANAQLTAHKAMLQKACAELPVSYYPDNTPEKLSENISRFVKDYAENFSDMQKALDSLEQITASHFYQSYCRGGEMGRLMNKAIEVLGGEK